MNGVCFFKRIVFTSSVNCFLLTNGGFAAHLECARADDIDSFAEVFSLLMDGQCVQTLVPPQENWTRNGADIPIKSGLVKCDGYEVPGVAGSSRNMRENEEIGVQAEVSGKDGSVIFADVCEVMWSHSH